ncbi:MAG TPA: HDIG domain-containing protein [Tepidiformaceae bacterium]|nr:HDIG domain-containing protein [Tepidiformaceae bacterium]
MLRRRPAPIISRTGAALFGLVIALAAGLLVVPLLPGAGALAEGEIAPRTLEARRDAQYVSEVQTEAARTQAAEAVDDVLEIDPGIELRQQALLDTLFTQLRDARQRTDLSLAEKVALVQRSEPASALPTAVLSAALELTREQSEAALLSAHEGLDFVFSVALTDAAIDPQVNEYITTRTSTLTTPQRTLVEAALELMAIPNFRVNEAATETSRANAAANVSPVVVTLNRGQVIAREGEVLDAAALEALEESGTINNRVDDIADITAGLIAAGGLGLVLALYLYQLQPVTGVPGRRLLLCALTFVATLAAARIAFPLLLPDTEEHFFVFALPVAAVAMVTASLLELHFAAIVAVTLAFFTAFMAATLPDLAGASFLGPLQAFQIAMTFTVSGLVGAFAVYRAERFSRYAVAAIAVALATWLVLATFWLLSPDRSNEALAWLSLAATINGLASAVITVGVFVVVSQLLGITTRLQLMELGQVDAPLLVRLQDEAPGTFHHSMMVGTLAERAASRIGADALITRVGAYYHDIGKISQPRYYIENMIDGHPSAHDGLPPTESARRIIDHVTNGIDIARRYRLPPVIRDFIPQHHGTRLVTFFYRRASGDGQEAPDPAAFRYIGPRPQTKETAIVMLADSAEAVVRAAGDRGRPRIDELVDGVLAERLAEGQLDECDITMRDLQDVAASFKATLRAVYHPRIEYPAPSAEELAAIARPELPEPPVISTR